MARSIIPDPLKRRHLVERELPEAQSLRLAQAYREAGRSVEAVDFLQKAGAVEDLAAIRAEAIEQGDAFLYRMVLRALGEDAVAGEWRELGRAASACGKTRYAEEAERQAGRGEE